MDMTTLKYAAVMLAAGVGIPVLAALNAALGVRLGSPVAAAACLFTVALKGGYEACVKFVDSLELFSHVANLGDTRSLVIHSASTTHRQLTPEQQEAAGAAPNVVRISIGIEDADDLIRDLDQALAKAHG